MNFVVYGQPQGKARPRVTKNGVYTPAKTKEYERQVRNAYKAAGGYRFLPDEEITVRIVAFYAIPKSAGKSKRARMLNSEILPTVKPDLDNIAKAVLDALNGIAYDDDSQVVNLYVCKRYSEKPCVCVSMANWREDST